MTTYHTRTPMLVATAAAVMLGGIILASCGGKPDAAAPKRVAGIVFQEDQFFRLVLFGMRDAAKERGVDLLEANTQGKPDREIQLINTYIANRVDGIIISPLSVRASMSALERAREKGIAVVTYNTTVEGNAPAAFVESDQTALGTSTGVVAREYIATKLGGKASIALLGFQSQTPEQHAARLGGFKSEVLKLPGVKVVAEQDAWLAEQAVKKAGDILTANPDVNIIFAGNEGGTVGAVMAVKNAGKAGKVAVFGVDIGDQIMDLLLAEDAILQAVTGQRPYEIGKLSLEIMLKVLNGEKVEPKVSLPGLLLVRDKPDEVRAFKSRLHELTR